MNGYTCSIKRPQNSLIKDFSSVVLMCVKVHSCTGDFNSFLLRPKVFASCVSNSPATEKNVGCLHNFFISLQRLFNIVCCHRSVVGVKDGGPPGGVDPDLPHLPSPPPPRPTQLWVEQEERNWTTSIQTMSTYHLHLQTMNILSVHSRANEWWRVIQDQWMQIKAFWSILTVTVFGLLHPLVIFFFPASYKIL